MLHKKSLILIKKQKGRGLKKLTPESLKDYQQFLYKAGNTSEN